MDKREDSKLEQWQIEDADRLLRFYKKYRSEGGLNQEEFARAFGLKSQGNMGHYLHGRSPLNVAQARNFAAGLGCAIADFSPRLAREAESNAEFASRQPGDGKPDIAKKYEQASLPVKEAIDNLVDLPPEEAEKLAQILKSIRATYVTKS